jgi:hypothetical protein
MTMDEQTAMQLVAAAMSNDTTLQINIQIKEAWMIVSAMQLASRHPDLSTNMKTAFEHIARQYQAAITAVHPEVHEVLEMGWNPDYDVESSEAEEMDHAD